MTIGWEGLGNLSQLGDMTAEVEGDTGDLVGQWWTILHIHTRAGMMWQGCKKVNHPSMGSGWHAQIGTSLGMKGPRGSRVVRGVPWATMRDRSQ